MSIGFSLDGQSETLQRPFDFDLPAGSGPVTFTVKDEAGRVAQTVTIPSNAEPEMASTTPD